MRSMKKPPEKILIRGVNWIGDAVLTTPALHTIRKAFPESHIALLVKPWVADIFKGNPDINETIIYEEKFQGIIGKIRLVRMLSKKGFNMAILLQNAFDAALITYLAGIPERIGYIRDYRRPLLTKPISLTKDILKKHHVYYYLNILNEAFGIETDYIKPHIYLKEEEINQAKNLLNSKLLTRNSEVLIGINPGATYGSAKRWLPERFAVIIQKAINELGAKIILFGSTFEAEIASEIIMQSTEPGLQNTDTSSRITHYASRILNMTGKTMLRELIALINECDVFITNDSGPMHIASALNVPVVAIFGSTDKNTTGPLGEGHIIISKDLHCSPCLKRECPEGHLKCMKDITTDEVFNALNDIIPKHRAVFLDRDGTINEDVGYLNSFDNLRIFPKVHENMQKLKHAGFKLIGITNQSGIARKIATEEFVRQCNSYLQKTLNMDGFYYCPHHPDDNCPCRKPKPLLLRKARLEHRINLKKSYVIGDKSIDVMLAKAVGARGILVQTGHDKESEHADFIAKDLSEAVNWILEQEK
jgi:heptosyltransferase-2